MPKNHKFCAWKNLVIYNEDGEISTINNHITRKMSQAMDNNSYNTWVD